MIVEGTKQLSYEEIRGTFLQRFNSLLSHVKHLEFGAWEKKAFSMASVLDEKHFGHPASCQDHRLRKLLKHPVQYCHTNQ